jgi:imidazolonepropionase-like amidohydrolase
MRAVTPPSAAGQVTPFRLIRAGQLWDARGGSARDNAAVLLEGDVIRTVGPAGEVRPPDGAPVTVHEYPNATLLPGLVDVHTHLNGFGDGRYGDELSTLPEDVLLLQAARNARAHLEAGVTTLRDCGSKGRSAFALRQGVSMGITPSPRLVLCGRPVTITGGHLWYFGAEADGVDGVRRTVRQLLKEGADFIKIVATGGSTRTSFASRPAFNVDEMHALVDEAHKFGKPTAAHSSSTQGIVNALEAGVDTIIHCRFIEPDGTLNYRPEVADAIAAAERWVDGTLAQGLFRVHQLEQKRDAGQPLTGAETREIERGLRSAEVLQDHFRRMLAAGVKMVSGSDSSWMWYPMGHFQEEVIEHAAWGMSVTDALISGTRHAAKCVGVDALVGTVEAGKIADLLVVQGDLLQDITALRHVRQVFQAGRPVHAE